VTIAAILLSALILALIAALLLVIHALRTLRETAEELRRTTAPVLADVKKTVVHANAELERVDDVVSSAQSVSRVAHAAFENPVVKVLAFGRGVARAGRRLRG
jgi:hypothetical protein